MDTSSSIEDIKKKYKSLMIITHPDMTDEHDYPYDASEINVAYEYLLKYEATSTTIYGEDDNKTNTKARNAKLWNAPENANAYAMRDILEYAEDTTGEIHGTVHIATGKYIWTEDEDFSLFLLSIYNCSKKIIENAENDRGIIFDEVVKSSLHKEIAYLLAGQYVEPDIVLMKYAKDNIYDIPAMLEYNGTIECKDDELVYPKMVKSHKMYLMNKDGQELGYLSFKDDRLYYCLIPLFEARNVMVKIRTLHTLNNKRTRKRYSELSLQVMLKNEDPGAMIDSINIKIDNLLYKANSK